MRSLRLLDLAKPCFIQCQMWRFGWHVRSMAISPWGDDSREVKRWGFTGSQWKKLHRRLRLHGVRLPKIWIMDPNKNYHMLGNIKQMKEYNMTYDQQRMAMLEGVFLFTKVSLGFRNLYSWDLKDCSGRLKPGCCCKGGSLL